MKKIIIVIVLCMTLCSCNVEANKSNMNNNNYKEIMENNEYIIVDVRTKNEYNEGHIKDSINIPLNEIDTKELDKNKVIFVYCKSGTRSKQAYEKLKEKGYSVYNLGAFESIDLPKE